MIGAKQSVETPAHDAHPESEMTESPQCDPVHLRTAHSLPTIATPSAILAGVYFALLFLGILWPIGCIARWDATLLALKVLPIGGVIGLLLSYSAIRRWPVGVSLLLIVGFLLAGKWIGHPIVLGILTVLLTVAIIKRRAEWLPGCSRALPKYKLSLTMLVPCSLMSVSAMQYAGLDIWNDVVTGQLSIDTCFHAAIASMIGQNNSLSIGLHGLTPVGYHFFSHLLTFGASRWSAISVIEAYASVPALVYLPLLPAAMLAVAASLSPEHNGGVSASRVGCLSFMFFGFSQGWPLRGLSFQIVSESFLCALVFFCGFVSDLCESNRARGCRRWILWLPILAMSKVSVGFFSGCALWLVILTNAPTRQKYWRHALLASVLATVAVVSVGWWGILKVIHTSAGADGLPGATTYARWALVLNTVRPFGMYSWPEAAFFFNNTAWLFSGFFLLMWDWFWIFLTLRFFQSTRPNGPARWYFRSSCLLFFLSALIAWLAPNSLAIVYFFFVPTFMGMLGVLSLLPSENPTQEIRGPFNVCLAVFIFLSLVGSAFSGVPKFASAWTTLHGRSQNRKPISEKFPDYVRFLRDSRRDRKLAHFAIHIPPDRVGYWGRTKIADKDGFKFDDAYRNAFLIPAISEKPSLFGLPYVTDGYFRGIYGLHHYSDEILAESLKPHAEAELNAVAVSFGLKGTRVAP